MPVSSGKCRRSTFRLPAESERRTSIALGIEVPPAVISIADEVIE
jgi:hypothetical protein